MPNSLLDDLPQVPGSESESSTETSVVATGTSVGSALYHYYSVLKKKRVFYKPNILLDF